MGSQSKRQVCAEIQRSLATALAKRGLNAQLSLTDLDATLQSQGRSVDVSLGDLPHRWPQLSSAERSRRVALLAGRLTTAIGAGRTNVVWTTAAPLLVVVAITLGLGVPLVRGAVPNTLASTAPTEAVVADRATQSANVCETTRSRIMRGATAGPADHEGWLFELSLVRRAPAAPSPGAEVREADAPLHAPDEFFRSLADGRLAIAWTGSPQLTAISDGFVEHHERRQDSTRESVYVFHGGYVRSYFAHSGREQWQRFAAALAKQVEAQFGGLYARCAHQSSHHIGSWYVGESAGAAAAALVYYDAAFSAAPVLAPGFRSRARNSADRDESTASVPRLTVLMAIAQSAADVKREQLAIWLAKDDGLVSQIAGRTMLQFPFRDSNRAARSSIRFARHLGIASER